MQKLLHLPTVLCVVASAACSEVEVQAGPADMAGAPSDVQATPPESFFDEVVLPTPTANKVVDEAELGSRAAGVQLARMTVSEATSLQPLNETWMFDMQGILQVARNTLGSGSLLEALKELSPHIGTVKPYTDDRQPWISTLPSRGSEAPELWVECVGWETVRGRKQGVPEGCHGVWELGAENWVAIRTYAINLVKSKSPDLSVNGNPTTWGGVMDIVTFLKNRPNLCWIESGPTTNYFFGAKTDSANTCKPIPLELVVKSRTVSADIVAKSIRNKTQE